MAEIVLDQVTKRFPDGALAVDNISLDIADGEFVILVGPSGCGKSTTLNMIAGLEDITEGELRIGGKVVNNAAPKDRDIAMVFQSYALYPHMTVRENMGFALKLAKTPQKVIDEKVNEAARVLDLTQHLDRRPANLSGGQRQRVAMGRAIVRDPAAFLMDEPLSNLDAKLRVQMRTEVSRLQRRLGTTTVYVTHDQTEAMTLGDRVAVMRNGLLQQVGSPQELYDRPDNLFVAGFIGSPAMNFLPSVVENNTLHTPLGDVPLTGRLQPGAGAGQRAAGPDRRHPPGGLRGRRAGSGRRAEQRDHLPRQHRRAGVDGLGRVRLLHQGLRQRDEVPRSCRNSPRTPGARTPAERRHDGRPARHGDDRAAEGHESELWADLRSMHVFNPATGSNITLDDGPDGPVTGGTGAAAPAASPERGSTGTGSAGTTSLGRAGRAGNGGYLSSCRSRSMTSSFHSWVRMRR